mgnify:CR=1 FL=1
MARYDAPSATQADDLTVETLLDTEADGVVGDDVPGGAGSFADADVAVPVASAASEGDRILSVAQVARRLGCSVSLVQKWRRLGWIPAIQLGPPDVPIYGYRVADVDAYAERAWNRRRGRPPKDPNAVPAPRRRAAVVAALTAAGLGGTQVAHPLGDSLSGSITLDRANGARQKGALNGDITVDVTGGSEGIVPRCHTRPDRETS